MQAEQKEKRAAARREEAPARTREVERRVQAIGSVLTDRDRGLEPLRLAPLREGSNAALESGDAEAYAERIAQLLEERSFLKRSHPEVAYSSHSRRLTVAVDLPRPEGIPAKKAFRYIAAQDEIVAVPRQEPERRRIYRDAVARLALCAADYVAALTTPETIDVIAVNGHVHGTDPATGQPGRPCLVTLVVSREDFPAAPSPGRSAASR